MNRVAVTVLVSLVVAPSLLAAQSGLPLPPVGSHAVSFALPDGGGAGVGVRKLVSERRSVGVELQLGVAWHDVDTPQGEGQSQTTLSVGLSPDLRMYTRDRGPVMPFVEWTGRVGYRDGANDTWAVDGRLGLGLGVEWFPLPSMSVSGSTGLALSLLHQSNGGLDTRAVTFGAFRSELSMNLYF